MNKVEQNNPKPSLIDKIKNELIIVKDYYTRKDFVTLYLQFWFSLVNNSQTNLVHAANKMFFLKSGMEDYFTFSVENAFYRDIFWFVCTFVVSYIANLINHPMLLMICYANILATNTYFLHLIYNRYQEYRLFQLSQLYFKTAIAFRDNGRTLVRQETAQAGKESKHTYSLKLHIRKLTMVFTDAFGTYVASKLVLWSGGLNEFYAKMAVFLSALVVMNVFYLYVTEYRDEVYTREQAVPFLTRVKETYNNLFSLEREVYICFFGNLLLLPLFGLDKNLYLLKWELSGAGPLTIFNYSIKYHKSFLKAVAGIMQFSYIVFEYIFRIHPIYTMLLSNTVVTSMLFAEYSGLYIYAYLASYMAKILNVQSLLSTIYFFSKGDKQRGKIIHSVYIASIYLCLAAGPMLLTKWFKYLGQESYLICALANLLVYTVCILSSDLDKFKI